MSDLADDAEGIRILIAGGARFGKRAKGDADHKLCSHCGVGPVRRTVGDKGKEILICPGCGAKTEPLKSRQALLAMWNGMN